MLQGKYQVPSPNTMECTWQGSSLSTGSYYLGCVLKKCGEGWGAGVQPQQSPGIPSGWAVLVKEWHGETKLQWARPITLFSKKAFISWLVHRGKWKMQDHAESAQTFQQFCPYWNQDFFLHTFPINKGPMLCTLSSGLGGLLTFYDPFLIKVDQPENLFSLEVFFFFFSLYL